MFTAHPTLLIGPADWRPDVMPKEEFERRIAALWQAAPDASHVVVFGSPGHHAELAYVTNLTPKLEAVVALLARDGTHRLFVGGGANMVGAARPLSFIDDMAPLNALVPALKAANSPALLIGGGAMPTALYRTIVEALGAPPQDATAQAWRLMRKKSARELAATREACAILTAAMEAMRQIQNAGAGATDVVLAGERAANEAGAQDVRTLFSLDGGRSLQPFVTPVREAADPLQVYMAVRRFNYWAEGFAPLSPQPRLAAQKAMDTLRTTLGDIKVGTRPDQIATAIATAITPYRLHPATSIAVTGIGLALEEPSPPDGSSAFAPGDVYSLKIGLTDGRDSHAIVSAMVAINDGGSDVLWQTATSPGSQ